MSSTVEELLQRHAAAVDRHLRQVVSRHSDAPARLLESITYSLTAGGKRLRPALLLECCHACGEDDFAPAAIPAAAAIELIHTFSLVHDDLPAMDDDDLRRGKPTNHKVFGEAMAILAGDAMVMLAFQTLAFDATPALVPALINALAAAAGPSGMIGGQVGDMAGENHALSLPQLQHIHAMKTGALITAACQMGAICARADNGKLAAIIDYGRHLGMAFQIVDDLLDVTSTPQELGKATSKDARIGKNTYPGLLGTEASWAAAAEHVDAAVAALDEFASLADGLRAIARFVISRKR